MQQGHLLAKIDADRAENELTHCQPFDTNYSGNEAEETEVCRLAEVEIHNRELYSQDRSPHPLGVLDDRLGVNSKFAVCSTCKEKMNECVGHFGCKRVKMSILLRMQ